MKNNGDKTIKVNNRKLKRIIKAMIALVVIIVFAVLIEAGIESVLIKKNAEYSTTMVLNQVENVLDNNERDESGQLADLKETYITAAQAGAYILSDKPEIIDDVEELKSVAKLMSVDELHVFDKNGVIISGTNPEYYGYSFDSGEQMAYFKPMLSDKTLTMCQDVTPNTASKKYMMYAIAWNSEGSLMIQVGVEPKRLIAALKNHEISNVISDMPIAAGFDIYAVDIKNKSVVASTNREMKNSTIPARYADSFGYTGSNTGNGIIRHKGDVYYCNYRLIGDYIIAVIYNMGSNKASFIAPLFVIALYLLIAGTVIALLFFKLQRTEEKKNYELQKNLDEITLLNESLTENNSIILSQNTILKSMADIYFSMHVIDLVTDEVIPYSYHGTAEIFNRMNGGARKLMPEIIRVTTQREYLKRANEFTNLDTLPDRMTNKKMIRDEFVGKGIGWYEATFIVVQKDENERPTKVIFATRSIDEEKKKEETLIHRSNTDELTGFYNRRAYEEAIKECINNGLEEDFVYVSIDINGLKRINDTIGHEAGDELIVGACNCIKKSIGSYGSLYRTGGDEFIGLINADDMQLEAIKRALEEETSAWHGKLVDSLSVSAGFVRAGENRAASLHDITILADKRMYEAKSMHYSKQGVDRRGQKDAHIALCALYTKILKINATKDTYQIVDMDESEQTVEKGFADKISDWLKAFGQTGQVHPDDLEEYLQKTDLNYISNYFKDNKTSLHIFYRRKCNDEFKQVMLEIIPANDYNDNDQNLYLYVKNIDK